MEFVCLLRDKLIPECHRVTDDNYIFRQDSAPSHCCRLAQQFLQANTPHFIHSDAWPLKNPELYILWTTMVWNALKERVYFQICVCWLQKTFLNTDEFKQ